MKVLQQIILILNTLGSTLQADNFLTANNGKPNILYYIRKLFEFR